MAVEIREARISDVPSIRMLIIGTVSDGAFLLPRERKEIENLINKGNFFVAEAEGDMVGDGIVGCASLEEYYDVAEVRSLVVMKTYRGMGLGEKLIEQVAALASRKYDTLYAFADESLVGFYEGQRFENKGKFIDNGKVLNINSGISWKLKEYCLKCQKYNSKPKQCNEYLMQKRLKS